MGITNDTVQGSSPVSDTLFGGIISGGSPPVPPVDDFNRFISNSAPGGGTGSQLNPWTFAEGHAQAVAGDRVGILPGNFPLVAGDTGGTARDPTYHPANDGTEMAPIVFGAINRAVYNDTDLSVIIANSGQGSLLGNGPNQVTGGNYIHYDGLKFELNTGSYGSFDTGSFITNWNSIGMKLLYCASDFDDFNPGNNVNWGLMFNQYAVDVEIADCSIINQAVTNEENNASIMTYGTSNLNLHHCYGSNLTMMLFPKGDPVDSPYPVRDNTPMSMHHCDLRAMQFPFQLGGIGGNDNAGMFLDIYQNRIDLTGMNPALMIFRAFNTFTPRRVRIVNNTFYQMQNSEGIIYGAGGPTVSDQVYDDMLSQNNIVYSTTDSGRYYLSYTAGTTIAALAKFVHDRNCYYRFTRFFNDDGASNFAWWQGNGFDVNGILSDPLLVNGAAGDLRIQNSALGIGAGTSPCLNLGVDVLNLLGGGTSAPINAGAYILADQSDVIGIRPEA